MEKILKLLTVLSLTVSLPISVASCSNQINHSKYIIHKPKGLVPAISKLTPAKQLTLSDKQLKSYTIKALNTYFSDPKHQKLNPNQKLLVTDILQSAFNQQIIFKLNNQLFDDISFNLDLKNIDKFNAYKTYQNVFNTANVTGTYELNLKDTTKFDWINKSEPNLNFTLKAFNSIIDTTANVFIGTTNDFIFILNSDIYTGWADAAALLKGEEFLAKNNIKNTHIKITEPEWQEIAREARIPNSDPNYWAVMHVVNKQIVYTNMSSTSTVHDFHGFKDPSTKKYSQFMPQISYKDNWGEDTDVNLFINKNLLNKLNLLYSYSQGITIGNTSVNPNSYWNVDYITNYLKQYQLRKASDLEYNEIAKCLMDLISNHNSDVVKIISTINVESGYYGVWLSFDENDKFIAFQENQHIKI